MRSGAASGDARSIRCAPPPEVECIGERKPHKPYEFGVKASVATTLNHSVDGPFVVHTAAQPGNPYDGHTLVTVLPDIEAFIGVAVKRCFADAGYNFRRLIRWLSLLLRRILTALCGAVLIAPV